MLSIAAWFAAPAAAASTPFVDIHSAGPLSDIYIGNDLSCQVRSGGFSSTEFFPNASGSGRLRDVPQHRHRRQHRESSCGPDFANHAGGTNTTGKFSTDRETPVTPVSQSLTGSGTAASPYQVTTVVTSDPTRTTPSLVFRVTEVDTLRGRQ